MNLLFLQQFEWMKRLIGSSNETKDSLTMANELNNRYAKLRYKNWAPVKKSKVVATVEFTASILTI